MLKSTKNLGGYSPTHYKLSHSIRKSR